MLFSKDPVMPFEMADRLKYSQDTSCNNVSQNDNECEVTDSKNCDLIQTVEKLEKHQEEIYQNAKGQTKKSQEHQARGYNNRQTKGKPFDVGSKVLKLNLHQKSRKEKMTASLFRTVYYQISFFNW